MSTNKVNYPGDGHWVIQEGKVKLIGTYCQVCNAVYFPRQNICSKCFEEKQLAEIKVGPYGKLYSFSIVHTPPKGFSNPYAVGFADFPENVRVFAQLTESDMQKLKLDMDVELIIEKIWSDESGNEKISYKFKPSGGF